MPKDAKSREAAKAYLQRGYDLTESIATKQEMATLMEEQAMKITTTLSGMPHAQGFDSSKIESATVKRADLLTEIDLMTAELAVAEKEIAELISQVQSQRYQNVLRARYVYYFSWDAIAASMHRTYRYVFKLHRTALDVCAELLREKDGN